MAKQYKRGKNSRFRYALAHAARAILRVCAQTKAAFKALRPRGRITLLASAGALFIAAVFLLRTPPVKKDEALPAAGVNSFTMADTMADQSALSFSSSIVVTPTPTPASPASLMSPSPSPTPDLTLYEGMQDSPRVTELQNRLMDLGYLDLDEPTEHFGPATKDAVKRFERQHDLEQDGFVDADMLALINSDDAKKYTLLEGARGSDIENFQRQLKELGYLSKVTGYYGDETVAAVKAFQKQNKLSEDGKAGQQTFDILNSDKAKASPSVAKEKRRKANIDVMIETAKKAVGKTYILGNEGPNSFDCSGLVYYCLKQAGSNRRRLNAAGYSQVSDWEKISFSSMKRGDLVFFYNNAKTKVGHVGIYLGGGEMIDASSNRGKVVRRSVNTSYWKEHFVCARRPW